MALAKYNTSELSNKGQAVALLSPSGDTTIGIRFYLLGIDSKAFQKLMRKYEDEDAEQQKRMGRKVYRPSAELKEERQVEMLVAMTIGWDEDVCDEKGKVISVRSEIELEEGQYIPFSPEAAKEIYTDLGYKFIREQVDAEIGDRRGFLSPPKRN